jgi:hypothetical protein
VETVLEAGHSRFGEIAPKECTRFTL